MEIDRAKQIIVSILQQTLIGQLDPSSHFNPQFVAEAIAAKVDFGKTYSELKNDKVVGKLVEAIVANKTEMTEKLEKLTDDKKLLVNFIRGKLTAYEEILNAINTL